MKVDIVFIILIVGLCGLVIFLNIENHKLKFNLESFEMYYRDEYGDELDVDYGIYGVAYQSKGFFCVWAKDRVYSDVIETCNHEWLHLKYYYDWQHFDRKEEGNK